MLTELQIKYYLQSFKNNLDTNLIKHVHNLHAENYKILMKKSKKT